jgi:glycosyltransferase involved in cell wall biosynthesis
VKVLYALSKYPQLSETYVTAEIAFMLRAGVDVRVWSPFARIPEVRPQTICYADTLSNAVQAFKPDLVHVHHMGIVPGICKQLEGLKVPVTVRGHSFDFSPELARRLVEIPTIEKLYLFPHFARQVPHHKVMPLVVAFDSTRYRPQPDKDSAMILRLGAGLDTKNLGDFFAIARLCPGFRFIAGIATCDDAGRVAARFVAAKPHSSVSVFKDVSWEAAALLTMKAGIFIHTYDQASHPFGMPISIAEAMASGSTVLIRDTMAAREFAGDAAFYYKTPEEAAETINISLAWTPVIRQRQFDRAVLQGQLYADNLVLPRLLHDWESIAARRR